MRYIVPVLILLIAGQATTAQVETVLERYREHLFRMEDQEQERLDLLIASFSEEQQWPDINYNDQALADWKVSHHLRRVAQISKAWANPESSYYQNAAAWKMIKAGLDHWLDKRYQNSNWWHNQIGVPQYMRDIIILLDGNLSEKQRQGALEVLAQHNVLEPGAGANLIWSADLGFHYGALTNDSALMRKCRDLVVNEVMISTGEGIQPDNSFHQHGNRLQMYQYGKAFLLDNIRFAWQLRNTSLEFPRKKVDMLTNFVLEGWQWMARGSYTVPGTMDRSVSRKGELKSADIRKFVPYLCELKPENTSAFQELKKQQDGQGFLKGYRYYPYSDFSAYHHEDFSFFLKTISERTLPTESINNENLKGRLLNSGDAYLIRDGQEYYNLMPVLDWEKLPGVTGFKGADHVNRHSFVGSVSNGSSGLTVMDYRLSNEDNTQSLSTHKLWTVHENIVVCLMTELQTENIDGKIYTALDQCRWRGDVVVNKPGNVLNEGIHNMEAVNWIYHGGFAYIPISSQAFDIHLQEKTGVWSDINLAESTAPVNEKIFMPVMQHNLKKEGTGYAFVSCSTVRQAKKIARKPRWEVLRNDSHCQAVAFKDGTVMAAFFSPGQLIIEGDSFEIDKPCLVMISNNQLHVSDPTHTGGMVNILWKGESWEALLNEEGFTNAMHDMAKIGKVLPIDERKLEIFAESWIVFAKTGTWSTYLR